MQQSDTPELPFINHSPLGLQMAPSSLGFLPISVDLPQFPLLRPASDLLVMSHGKNTEKWQSLWHLLTTSDL